MNLHQINVQSEIQLISDFMRARHPAYWWEPHPTQEGALRYTSMPPEDRDGPNSWLMFNRYDTQGQRQRALAWDRNGRQPYR